MASASSMIVKIAKLHPLPCTKCHHEVASHEESGCIHLEYVRMDDKDGSVRLKLCGCTHHLVAGRPTPATVLLTRFAVA